MLIDLPARTDVPKTKIFVQIEEHDNDNRPNIIMLPGGPGGNATVYDEITPQLATKYRIVRFDPRGCARSSKDHGASPQFCTINHYVDDVEALRKILKIDKFVLFGASYGAMAAFQYATRYCQDSYLKSLITVGGAASGKFIEEARAIVNAKLKKGECTTEQLAWMEKLFAGAIKDAEEFRLYYGAMQSLYFSSNSHLSVTPAGNSATKKYDYYVKVTNNGFRPGGFLRIFDISSELSKITCPVLSMVGKDDWINTPQHIESINKTIASNHNPKVITRVIENSGHFVWLEMPDIFYEAIFNFI